MSRCIAGYLRRNLLGFVAIFIALTGTAFAVQKAPRNSVVSKSIKKGAVTTKKIRTGAVTGPKVSGGAIGSIALANDSVDSAKVADDSLTGADIVESTLVGVPASGAAGGDLTGNYPSPTLANAVVTSATVANGSLTGEDIEDGSLGSADLAALITRQSAETLVASGGSQLISVSCDPGEQLVSGGGVWTDVVNAADYQDLVISHSFPTAGVATWRVRATNNSATDHDFQTVAVCLG